MSAERISSFASLFLAALLVLGLLYRLFRMRLKRWWHKGDVIEGFSRQKWERERHKDDEIGR